MQVETIHDPGAEWDAFAEATPGASLGHASAWARVLCDAYGLRPHYLGARTSDGALAGILPLFAFRALSGGLEWISVPFLDTAGPLCAGPEAAEALRDAALQLSRESRARALELRERASGQDAGPQPRVDLVLALEADEEAQWKALGSKVRNQTRKAEREGLEIATGHPSQLLDDFYTVFCANMRDLGSPPHGREFFRLAADRFGERWRFVVTRRGANPIGGLAAIRYAGAVSVPWASTLRTERRRCPNNQIYWEALRWAIAQGAAELDFGRSPPDSGTYRFKRGWGAQERPLAWRRWRPDGTPLPVGSPGDSALLRRLSDVWSRLPLGLTNRLGPLLRRRIAS